MVRYDVAVVGGGCVGLAAARHLASEGVSVCVLEKEQSLAAHQSGRNSGTLYPGFASEPGSRVAAFSRDGTRRTKAFCRERGVPVDDCGMVMVADGDAETERLRGAKARADENGVETRLLDGAELAALEPHVAGDSALLCPEAATLDSRAFVHALGADAEAAGADVYRGYEVTSVRVAGDDCRLETSKGALAADYVLNAAGLYADRFAHDLGVGERYRIVPFRGEYYELVPARRDRVSRVVYPTPDPDRPYSHAHFVPLPDGRVLVGPNAVLAFGREAYANTDMNPRELAAVLGYAGFWRLLASPAICRLALGELRKSYQKSAFVADARRLLPSLAGGDLVRSFAGVRAEPVTPDGTLIEEPIVEDGPRSTHVLNPISLTASLPFGEHVAERVLERY